MNTLQNKFNYCLFLNNIVKQIQNKFKLTEDQFKSLRYLYLASFCKNRSIKLKFENELLIDYSTIKKISIYVEKEFFLKNEIKLSHSFIVRLFRNSLDLKKKEKEFILKLEGLSITIDEFEKVYENLNKETFEAARYILNKFELNNGAIPFNVCSILVKEIELAKKNNNRIFELMDSNEKFKYIFKILMGQLDIRLENEFNLNGFSENELFAKRALIFYKIEKITFAKESVKKLKVEKINSFCLELNEYLKLNFGYKKDFAYTQHTNVFAKSAKFDLMIRFFCYAPVYNNAITIARIGFKEIRKGRASDFLKFLIEKSNIYNYEYLILECLITDEGIGFANYIGFEQVLTNDFSKNNYVISINKLKEFFKI